MSRASGGFISGRIQRGRVGYERPILRYLDSIRMLFEEQKVAKLRETR